MATKAAMPTGHHVIHDPDDGKYRVYRRHGLDWHRVDGLGDYDRRIHAVSAAWKQAGYTPPWTADNENDGTEE